MGTFTRGLVKIEVSDIAPDGDVGTSFAVLGKTKRDTAKITEADPTVTNIYSEENDTPEIVITTPGDTTFDWVLMDANADTLQKVFGGTVTGTSPNKKWSRPATVVAKEQSLRLTTVTGLTFVYPRMSLFPKFDGTLGRTDVLGVAIKATMLQPTKAGVPPTYTLE